jgi:endo-1,4-beta-xylanase
MKSPKLICVTLLSLCCFADYAVAQKKEGFQQGNVPNANGRRQPEPKWLMAPIQGKNLYYKTFDSPSVMEKVSYLIYLPPNYDEARSDRYPVVYWLHGIGGNQTGIPSFCQRASEAMASKKAPSMIFVFANGMVDSFYCDAINANRPVESVIMKELIPHVDATYRTIPKRDARMIEGFSMGGFGAAHLGFKYPDQFGSISIIDGALLGLDEISRRHQVQYQRIFDGSAEKFNAESPFALAEARAAQVRNRTVIRIVTRTTGLSVSNEKFHELLDSLSLANEFYKIPDAPHSPNPLYEGLGDENWSFYSKAFSSATKMP